MTCLLKTARTTLSCFLMTLLLAGVSQGNELAELVQVGAAATSARFDGVEADGALRFRDANGADIALDLDRLVRWSTSVPLQTVDAALMADGSCLALLPAWGSRASIMFDGQNGELRTASVGRIAFRRSSLRALLFRLPRDEMESARMIERASAMAGDEDQLLLDNGDVFSGTLLNIGKTGVDNSGSIVTLDGDLDRLELPLDRLRAIVFSKPKGSQDASLSVDKLELVVGLDDGSRIAATRLCSGGEGLVIDSPLLGGLPIDKAVSIASLQGLGNRIVYLSDLQPLSYVHQPYLDAGWPYRRDENVLGQPLRAGEQTFLKGLGVHSAGRLTYELDDSNQRFAATVAVDDAAAGGGSVEFRVRLATRGQWREAWSSGVVRGGEPPRPVVVELGGAEQIELVVDYADRGDERDYANWLDARLERQ